MAHAQWAFRQVFGDRDSAEEPADGAFATHGARALGCLSPGSSNTPHQQQVLSHLLAEDLISAVQFDKTGDYLATGDRGGRVVIFESSEVAQGSSQVSRHCCVGKHRNSACTLAAGAIPLHE